MTCRDEILEAVHQVLLRTTGDAFTVQQIVDEMRARNTLYEESTIRTHVTSRMCTNAPDNHAVVHRDLERIDSGTYRLLA